MAVVAVTRTAIGKKVLMALTGVVWVGFLVMHMYGNLKVFLGPEAFDHYAHSLRTFGEPILMYGHFLFAFRVLTVVAFVVHVYLAFDLTRRNIISRGNDRYVVKKSVQADPAALTMRYGGVFILLFVIYHLAQFTWGVKATLPEYEFGTAYANLLAGFQHWYNVLFYLVALFFLALHLYHGVWSVFQTFGINNRSTTKWIHLFSLIFAVGLTLGFAAVPLGIFFGFVS